MLGRVLSAVLLVGLTASMASAQSGLQITRDGKRTLISKDVGGERWAITLEDVGGVITGNIFEAAGGEPKFIACQQERVANGEVFLACKGADPCHTGPCTPANWTTIPGEIAVPLSFFKPPGSAAVLAEAADAPEAAPAHDDARDSGIQVSPDQAQVLVSKDVGGARWAITRHADDATVTGNVFEGAASPPKFVWCEETGQADGTVSLSCYGANPCPQAPCTSAEWTLIGPVTLSLAFFEPPTE